MSGAGGSEVGRISIRVVPDLDRFHRDLKAKLEELEKTLRGNITVDAHLDTLKARGDMGVLMAKLKADASRGVTIKADVDRSATDKFRDVLSTLGSKAGGLGGGGGIGHGIMIAAAVAAFAAPALALLSGVLVSMPAVISALLVPIAALTLGFDGIKKAAEVLTVPFEHLKATMAQRFQENFTPIFKDLLRIFPTLEKSMPRVADGISAIAASFVNTITSQDGLNKIEGIIGNIANLMSGLAPGVGKVTDGLLGLANGVSAKFPAVSTWFEKVGTSFDTWVKKISSPGVGGAAGGRSPLDVAMDNLGGTAKGLLDILGDLAKQGFDFLSDPKFGESMTNFVTSCQTLINDVLPSLKQFFMDISDSLKTITDTMDRFSAWKPPEWLSKLNGKPDDSKPTPQEDFDGSGKGAKNILELPDFGPLRAGWNKLITDIKTGWDIWVTDAKTRLGGVFDGLTNLVAPSFGAIGTTWATMCDQMVQKANGTGAILSTVWSNLPSIAAGIWNQVVAAVANALAQVVATIVTVGGQVVAEVSTWPGRIVGALGSLGGLLVGAGQALMSGLLQGITAGYQAVASFVSGIADKLAALKGPLPYDRKVLVPNGEALMSGLKAGIDNGMKDVRERTAHIANEISGALDTSTKDAVAGLSTGVKNPQIEELQKQIDMLELDRKKLKIEKNGAGSKEAKEILQSKMDEIQARKDILALQKDELKLADKNSVQAEKTTDQFDPKKLLGIGTDFAEATGGQFLSDLGIGGEGAISQALKQGLGLAKQTIFNVSSADEAIAIDKSKTAKDSLQYWRR